LPAHSDYSRQNDPEQAQMNADALSPDTTRRTFLTRAARKAVYAAPIVVVLGINAEARANSKDGIAWSQCGSFGEPCGGGACCPGFMCVAEPGNPHCTPG
jgi:hypothetical protein